MSGTENQFSTDNAQMDALEALCEEGPAEDECLQEFDVVLDLGTYHGFFAGCNDCEWWAIDGYNDGPDTQETKEEFEDRLRKDHVATGCKGKTVFDEF